MFSDWSVTASFLASSPYVEVVVPNGDEIWTRELDYFIQWKSNFSGDVVLELHKDNEYLETIDMAENNGAYEWEVPIALDSTCGYSILIKSIDNDGVFDVSNRSFAVSDSFCTNITIPFIAVQIPDGGEIWEEGEEHTIVWDDNLDEDVVIELLKADVVVETIGTVGSNGSYNWTVPGELISGQDYKIVVKSSSNSEIVDQSNDNFEIRAIQTVTKDILYSGIEFSVLPNPANDQVIISYTLSEGVAIDISLFNLMGQKVLSLVNNYREAGTYHEEYTIGELAGNTYLVCLRSKDTLVYQKLYISR
ncbi:hypothetical protein ES703_98337 [subsurface metagenome]